MLLLARCVGGCVGGCAEAKSSRAIHSEPTFVVHHSCKNGTGCGDTFMHKHDCWMRVKEDLLISGDNTRREKHFIIAKPLFR